MRKIFTAAAEMLENGESFVHATMLTSTGSTPRRAGSHMLITRSGEFYGTIGGGILEANVIKAASNVFENEKQQVVTTKLDNADSVCGGTASVLVDYIAPGDDSLGFYNALLDALRYDPRAKIVTAVPDSADGSDCRSQCVLRSDGTLSGANGFYPGVAHALDSGSTAQDALASLEGYQLYMHTLPSDGTAYIFGAGHCGQKLCSTLSAVGFITVVIDDREEFATDARFPDADAILVPQTLDKPFVAFEFDADSYIIIVTRGHVYDELVLRAALKTDAGYIGMIGSRRKRETIYKNLRADGFLSSDLERVYSPIGVQIDADTPEEIAVSIAAELIKVRAARRGK